MPKAKTPRQPQLDGDPALTPVEWIRHHADALCRAAAECCHQRDRYARLVDRSRIDSEEAAASQMCRASDTTLGAIMGGFERALATAPTPIEEDWYRPATTLWQSAREYLRRHEATEAATHRFQRHRPEELEQLHAEFELEASSLLSLRHACDGYRRARPTAG